MRREKGTFFTSLWGASLRTLLSICGGRSSKPTLPLFCKRPPRSQVKARKDLLLELDLSRGFAGKPMRWMLGKSEKPKATSTQEEAPINAAALERRISFLYDIVSSLLTHISHLQIRAMSSQEAAFPRERKRSEAIEVLKTQVDLLLIQHQAEAFKKHQEVVGKSL
ncbi:hypothetical protein [Xylella fastidiosa]|nr:hypothetical protein [Xylella fastidiosa]UIX80290.1 hypothetical protein LZ756_07135 [Xylella fastidiosa subsp. sandyi]